jgi:hypothetical protein
MARGFLRRAVPASGYVLVMVSNAVLAIAVFAGNLIYRSARAGEVTSSALIDSAGSAVIAVVLWIVVAKLRESRRR